MEERGFAFSVSQVLPKLIFLILIGLYILTSVNAVFENLLLAQVISYLSVFLILLWNTSTQWIPALKATIDKSQLFKMIRFGFPLIGGGLAFWGLTAMDRFFLRSLSSFSELGIYSVSVSFAGAALVFQAVFSTVWVPIVYKWASNDIEVNKVEEVINFVVVVVILIWSIAGMLSWIVPYLLPPEYNAVQNILLSAMAYPLLYTLSEATGVGIGIKRKTVYAMTAAIVALVLNGIGNFLFIPIYGAAGAAISSGFSFLVFLIVKTEISAKIWFDFSRYKIYLFMTVAVIFSAFMCLVEANKIIYPSLWFMFLLVSFVFFRKSYCSILMRIRNLR